MSLFTIFDVSASGLDVQRKRLDIAAENIANVNTTKTPEGGPYVKKNVIISASPLKAGPDFQSFLKARDIQVPEVSNIEKSKDPPIPVYDPHSPDADEKGFVLNPNISSTHEMIDVLNASTAYEANMTVFSEAKNMILKTLDLGGV